MPDLTSTTVSTSVLKVPIILDSGKKITINIPDPVQGITKSEIKSSSNEKGIGGYIVNENMVNDSGAMAVEVGDPYYYNTEKIVFD